MRILLYTILIGCSLLMPVQKEDVVNLQPVEAVFLERNKELYVVSTDTGEYGSGTTIDKAISNMKNTAVRVIYFDTARYLLVDQYNKDLIKDIRKYMKGNVGIYEWDGAGNIKDVVRYLDAHKDKIN